MPIRAIALSTLALTAGLASADGVSITELRDNTVEDVEVDDHETGTAESDFALHGSFAPRANRHIASARATFVHAYSVEDGGPRFALLWREHYEYDVVFTVSDPTHRGYELDLGLGLEGEIVLLGPTWAGGPVAASNLTAGIGFNSRFDDDLSDDVDDLGLSGLLVGDSRVGTGTVESDPVNLERRVRFDESANETLGRYVGTRSFAVRVTTRTAPAGITFQNERRGDAALVFGLGPVLPLQNLDLLQPGDEFAPLDAVDVATAQPADGLTISIGASFFCNAADIAAPIGQLDLDDVNAFLSAFVAGNAAADLVAPFGVVDISDVDAFIDAFLAGCP